jgi:hypothetical protein
VRSYFILLPSNFSTNHFICLVQVIIIGFVTAFVARFVPISTKRKKTD